MASYPNCQFHHQTITFVDLNKGIPLSQRALCMYCDLNKPTRIDLAMERRKDQYDKEKKYYDEYFSSFLQPVKKIIKSLEDVKAHFENNIKSIEKKISNMRDQIIDEKEKFMRSFNLDFTNLSISQIQNIAEVLSQEKNSIEVEEQIFEQFHQKVEQILQLQELKLLDQIITLQSQITTIFQEEEFQNNLKKQLLKFHPLNQIQFKLDCYASCVNHDETLIVASHNIELILYEINGNQVNLLDKIRNFGFFYQITFDRNDNNLLYLADYNSSLKIVRIENKKMKILETDVQFKQSVSCVVCTKNSEVILASQDLSFRSYKFINGIFTLIQEIEGYEKEICSITLNQKETLMATSHINYTITIWQRKDDKWVIQQTIQTNKDNQQNQQNQSQLKNKKDRNAVCFLNYDYLTYLSDSGYLTLYKNEKNVYQKIQEKSYQIDGYNHFPTTYTLQFNYKTNLLICHQYHLLEVFIQDQTGQLVEFQKFDYIRNRIVGCYLSDRYLLAQDSSDLMFHILKLKQ